MKKSNAFQKTKICTGCTSNRELRGVKLDLTQNAPLKALTFIVAKGTVQAAPKGGNC